MPVIKMNFKGKEREVYVEHGHSAEHARDFLMKYHDNAEDIFEAAHHAHGGQNGVTHFTLPPQAGYHGAHNFVLRHNSDGTFALRKKDTGLLAA